MCNHHRCDTKANILDPTSRYPKINTVIIWHLQFQVLQQFNIQDLNTGCQWKIHRIFTVQYSLPLWPKKALIHIVKQKLQCNSFQTKVSITWCCFLRLGKIFKHSFILMSKECTKFLGNIDGSLYQRRASNNYIIVIQNVPKNGQHSSKNNNNYCFYFFRHEQDQQFGQKVNNNYYYFLFVQIVDLYYFTTVHVRKTNYSSQETSHHHIKSL